MALVARGVNGWYLTVTVVDQQADTVTLTFDLQASDATTAAASVAAILAELSNRTLGAIKSTSMSYIQDENALAIPTNGADNSIKARISWLLAGGGIATQDITCPVADTWVAASGKNNNIVLGSVFGAWAALFATGGSAFISDGEVMTATPFVDGQRVSVKKGKRRS